MKQKPNLVPEEFYSINYYIFRELMTNTFNIIFRVCTMQVFLHFFLKI